MSKARLGEERDQYDEHMRCAQTCLDASDYSGAIDHAMAAWEYLDSMMKFEKRYEDADFSSVPCIDLVTKYAPLIFHHESLDRARELLRAKRSIERNTSVDLGRMVDAAVERMELTRKLWAYLETCAGAEVPTIAAQLGGTIAKWNELISECCRLGTMRREKGSGSSVIALASEPTGTARARCLLCGRRVQGKRFQFYVKQTCPTCRQEADFVIESEHEEMAAGSA